MHHAIQLLLALGPALGTPALAQEKKTIEELLQTVAVAEKPAEEPALAELLKRPDAREGALEVLRKSGDSDILGAAVLVLGRLGKRARNELQDILAAKEYSDLQIHALQGVGVAGAEGAWLAPEVLALAQQEYEALATRVKSKKTQGDLHDLRTNALTTLGLIGGDAKKSLAVIEKFLALKVDPQDELAHITRMIAACALWRLSGTKVRVLVLYGEGLDAGKGAVMERAVYGLGEMGEHAAPLRGRLEQAQPTAIAQLRVMLGEALDKIDGKKPVVGPKPAVK